MSTPKQIEANKKNALQSTGPKTIEGKIMSSKNSLKHGILSKDLVIKNESLSELEEIREAVYKDLNINGLFEEILAEKIIACIWRSMRVITAEREMFNNTWGENTIVDKFRGNDSLCMQSLIRYESFLGKDFYRALHELQRIQSVKKGDIVIAPIAIDVTNPE
jgi:hypothetical protein